MHIGVPKEIKNHEYRVGLTPEGTALLVAAGHRVSVERDAGRMIGMDDAAYRAAGAIVVDDATAVYAAELIVKVKEPQPAEVALLHPGQILFCYFHLAAAPELARALQAADVAAIAYETVSDEHGGLPLLQPMSEIAGRLAPQAGAQALHMTNGGNGVLICGLPGIAPAHVVILGAGVVGRNAARVAVGLGARVSVLDRAQGALAQTEALFGARVETRFSTADAIADILGGVAESSRPTTHSAPMYVEENIVHYCVANMPGAVARTATLALTHATLPYIEILAATGLAAVTNHPGLRKGLQVNAGKITHDGLAQDLATA
jgi:alanine dehydrogenase